MLLARIPLFMFQAVQAALLPRLSRLAARGELDEFLAGLRRLMVVVLVVGIVGTIGAYVLGPWAIELVYDAELSGRTLAMLALGSALLHGGAGVGPGRDRPEGTRPRRPRLGAGVIAFLLGTWLSSDDLFRRVEIGLLLASLASVIGVRGWHCATVWPSALARTRASMLEAMTDMPLES